MRIWFLLALASFFFAAGCSTPQFVGRPDLALVDAAALPPPTPGDLLNQGRPYLIGPFDRLSVQVYGIPEMDRVLQADATGRVTFPLVGVIEAAGLTPSQLGGRIEGGLRTYVRDPQVTVNLTETVTQMVTVSGEVQAPGQFPVLGRTTLVQAVARARGFTEFARQNQVVVFRRVGDRNMAALYDLRAIGQGIYPDPEIYANDIIMVGDSPGRRLFRDVIQGSGLLMAPLVTVLQQF